VYWLVVSAAWGTIRIAKTRLSVEVDDNDWGFGQILPAFLLIGPILVFIQAIVLPDSEHFPKTDNAIQAGRHGHITTGSGELHTFTFNIKTRILTKPVEHEASIQLRSEPTSLSRTPSRTSIALLEISIGSAPVLDHTQRQPQNPRETETSDRSEPVSVGPESPMSSTPIGTLQMNSPELEHALRTVYSDTAYMKITLCLAVGYIIILTAAVLISLSLNVTGLGPG